ncbi:succinylglutamate desuccinylase/aspartoacylase family protein [Klebsiella pneumoniae]|nr:succinylglutamate desuccinylase/aspartoacylase family protein [Klebsiella pneumoniae]
MTRRCRRTTKRRWTTSWSRRASSSDEGEFTLNLAADVENFTALPAGYEIARQAEKRWVVQARAPYILFPNAGVATGQRAGLLLRAAALRLPQPA